jgi:hypothetical protein
VHAILESPIHCFWISETELIKLRKTNGLKIVAYHKTSLLSFSDTIENIIDFRCPAATKDEQSLFHVKAITQKALMGDVCPIEYGSFDNYRFLVKW